MCSSPYISQYFFARAVSSTAFGAEHFAVYAFVPFGMYDASIAESMPPLSKIPASDKSIADSCDFIALSISSAESHANFSSSSYNVIFLCFKFSENTFSSSTIYLNVKKELIQYFLSITIAFSPTITFFP